MFQSKLLTADPKEHLKRADILLRENDNSLLQYAALEMRLAVERIIHNQLTLSGEHSRNNKKENDPKKKKLIMNQIDPESNHDYDIFLIDPESGGKIYWGEYKNIPESKIKTIEGRLGNLLHMKIGLKLGIENDPWYIKTRKFLEETQMYLAERISNSQYYFGYSETPSFELKKK